MKNLDRIYKLQEEFKDLYKNTGLIGVGDNHVQLGENYFLELFDKYEVLPFDNEKDKLIVKYKDLKIIALKYKQ